MIYAGFQHPIGWHTGPYNPVYITIYQCKCSPSGAIYASVSFTYAVLEPDSKDMVGQGSVGFGFHIHLYIYIHYSIYPVYSQGPIYPVNSQGTQNE